MAVHLRLGLLVLATLVCFPGLLAGMFLRSLGLWKQGMQVAARTQSAWSRLALFCLGIRLDTQGKRPPLNSSIIAANHLSYIDVLVLSALFPSRFIGKSEIAKWPVLGQVVTLAGTLFVKRGNRQDVPRVVSEMRRTLDAGISVSFFPEAWASRGVAVKHFHPGLFQAAALGDFPCLAVALSYSSPAGTFCPAWTVAWWGPVPIGLHIKRMLRQGPVTASLRWANSPVHGTDRKWLASTLESAVRERFQPLRQSPIPPPISGDPGPNDGLDGPLPDSPNVTYT